MACFSQKGSHFNQVRFDPSTASPPHDRMKRIMGLRVIATFDRGRGQPHER